MTEAVIFDCCEVLLTGVKGCYEQFGKLLGTDPATVKSRLMCDMAMRLFSGQATEEEYWTDVIRRSGWTHDSKVLGKQLRRSFREIPGTRNLIRAMRRQGYKTGLLSVHAREWVEYCQRRFRHHCLFDVVHYSYQFQPSKPHPESFVNLAAALGVSITNCVVVDDRAENIIAARTLGAQGVIFETAEQTEAELFSLLRL